MPLLMSLLLLVAFLLDINVMTNTYSLGKMIFLINILDDKQTQGCVGQGRGGGGGTKTCFHIDLLPPSFLLVVPAPAAGQAAPVNVQSYSSH